MEKEFINHKSEIEKINQRIQEYLWEKKHLFNSRKK